MPGRYVTRCQASFVHPVEVAFGSHLAILRDGTLVLRAILPLIRTYINMLRLIKSAYGSRLGVPLSLAALPPTHSSSEKLARCKEMESLEF